MAFSRVSLFVDCPYVYVILNFKKQTGCEAIEILIKFIMFTVLVPFSNSALKMLICYSASQQNLSLSQAAELYAV